MGLSPNATHFLPQGAKIASQSAKENELEQPAFLN
jgi:hypothetical protein